MDELLKKSDMTEEDIKLRYITPAIMLILTKNPKSSKMKLTHLLRKSIRKRSNLEGR